MRNLTRHSVEFYHTEVGNGDVTQRRDAYRLTTSAATGQTYHNAQITDYAPEERNFSRWPGVRLDVIARFNTADMHGTAGFGFWNHPFSPKMRGLPRLPRAAWFFYSSPPNDMPLAKDVPGCGWKCATINATRPRFLALAPLAPPGFLLMRVPALYERLWPVGQKALGVREQPLAPSLLTETHTYTVTCTATGVTFAVDGDTVLSSPFTVGQSLGFIAWIDNQYAIVTPQGRFGWGVVNVPHSQTLYLDRVQLTAL